MRNLSVSIKCILEREGKILLLKRAPTVVYPGRWDLPGGKMAENVLTAAAREVREETGFVLEEDLDPVMTFMDLDSPKPTAFILVKGRVKGKETAILNPHEHTKSVWLPKEKVSAFPNLTPAIQKMLKDVECCTEG